MKKFLLFAASAMVAVSASAALIEDIEFDLNGIKSAPGWAPEETKALMSFPGDGLTITNPEATKDNYNLQYIAGSGLNIVEGTEYTVTVKIKADVAGVIYVGWGNWGSKPLEGNIEIKEPSADWQTLSYTAKATADMANAFCLMQSGHLVGSYTIQCITVTHEGEAEKLLTPEEGKVLLSLKPGDDGLFGWTTNADKASWTTEDDVLKYVSSDDYQSWQCQFGFKYAFEADVKYYVNMDVKGTKKSVGSIFQYDGKNLAGDQVYDTCGEFTNFKVTPDDWTNVTIYGIAQKNTEDQNPNKLVVSLGYAGDFMVKNVKLYVEKSADDPNAVNSVELSLDAKGVYNMLGVKVADSLDQVAAPGLYITNGKKVIKK